MQTESKPRFGVIEWILACGVVLLVALLLVPRPSQPKPDSRLLAQPQPPTQEQTHVTTNQPPRFAQKPEEWGIEVVALYPAVNGRVLDLRYRILDTAKAALLPNEPGGIYLVDEATGATAMLPNSPKTGSIPQNPQKLEAGLLPHLPWQESQPLELLTGKVRR